MITASIVTYHTDPAELLKAVECLCADGIGHIYVVDNASEDVIRQAVSKVDNVSYIPSDNCGYGAGHNKGIRQAMKAGADYHVVLNSDVYWSDPVLKTLSEYMQTHPEVGQMMPKVLYPDGSLQPQCKLLPTPADLLGRRLLPASLMRRREQRYQLEFTGYDHIMNVPYLSGCFMFFRMDALRDVGIFDERFFMYPEDIDITRRIHERWLTLYYPNVSITHIYAVASRRNLRLAAIHAWNMVRYFNKWGWIFDSKRRAYNRRLLTAEGVDS